MPTTPILIKYWKSCDLLVVTDQINASVTRQIVDLLWVGLLTLIFFIDCDLLGNGCGLLIESKNVPVNYKAVLVSQHEEVVSENQTSDHINRVVRAERDHHYELHEQGAHGEVAPIVPLTLSEFKELDHADSDMARIEEISSLAIWHEYAHDSRVSPVIALRVLDEPYVL